MWQRVIPTALCLSFAPTVDTQGGKAACCQRELCKILTAGTLTDLDMIETSSAAYLMAIKVLFVLCTCEPYGVEFETLIVLLAAFRRAISGVE